MTYAFPLEELGQFNLPMNTQLAESFDSITKSKLWKSAQICFAALLLVDVPMLATIVNAYISDGTAMNFTVVLIADIGIASTWVVNTIMEWKKGLTPEEQKKLEDLNAAGPSSFGSPQ